MKGSDVSPGVAYPGLLQNVAGFNNAEFAAVAALTV
jgi:hypothetical protein